jgi:hypothetical protein
MGIVGALLTIALAVEKSRQLIMLLISADGRPRIGIDMGHEMFLMNMTAQDVLQHVEKLIRTLQALGYTKERRKDVVLVYDYFGVYPPKVLEALARGSTLDTTAMSESHQRALQHYLAMKEAGFTVVMAPGEAEAQVVALQRHGIELYDGHPIEKVDIIISNDSDVLALGATGLWFRNVRLFSRFNAQPCTCDALAIDKVMGIMRNDRGIAFTEDGHGAVWSLYALVVGCDFSRGVRRAGRVKMLAWLKEFGEKHVISDEAARTFFEWLWDNNADIRNATHSVPPALRNNAAYKERLNDFNAAFDNKKAFVDRFEGAFNAFRLARCTARWSRPPAPPTARLPPPPAAGYTCSTRSARSARSS